MEKLKIIPQFRPTQQSPEFGNAIENPNFVFPGSDQFENHSPPPSPPWTCAFPTGSVLDLLTYILSQNEQFFLEKIETTGQGSTGSSLAFRFLDNDLRPLLSVIHLPGAKVLLVDGKEGGVGGIGEEVNFMRLDDEIRLFDASGRTLLLSGRENGGGKDLRVSCGDFVLGLVDGFASCKKSMGIISGKNSRQQLLFQILPSQGEVAVEDVVYKILDGKVDEKDPRSGFEVGSVRKKDGFLLLRLSPHLNVRTKAVILVTMVSIYTKYHAVIKSRSTDAIMLDMDKSHQVQKRRRLAAYLFSILMVFFLVASLLVVVFAALNVI